MKVRTDLTGKKFNRWTVLNYARTIKTSSGQAKAYWLCKCDCGKVKEVHASSLVSGKSKSCNCIKGKAPGESGKRSAFNLYKTGASQRSIEFNINFEEFIKISSSNCYYCDSKPSNRGYGRKGIYLYNGMDRVDNTRGYDMENIVPCCKNCNLAKRQLTQNEFFELVKKIYRIHCE